MLPISPASRYLTVPAAALQHFFRYCHLVKFRMSANVRATTNSSPGSRRCRVGMESCRFNMSTSRHSGYRQQSPCLWTLCGMLRTSLARSGTWRILKKATECGWINLTPDIVSPEISGIPALCCQSLPLSVPMQIHQRTLGSQESPR